jgi:hypothetical protein
MTSSKATSSDGVPALKRLLQIARGHSGQCRFVACFLLSLYNGNRFKFDLTDLRCVDREIFDDMLAVLVLDSAARREVHTYFENGGAIFESLAQAWRIPDRTTLRAILHEAILPSYASEELHQAHRDYIASEKV